MVHFNVVDFMNSENILQYTSQSLIFFISIYYAYDEPGAPVIGIVIGSHLRNINRQI